MIEVDCTSTGVFVQLNLSSLFLAVHMICVINKCVLYVTVVGPSDASMCMEADRRAIDEWKLTARCVVHMNCVSNNPYSFLLSSGHRMH